MFTRFIGYSQPQDYEILMRANREKLFLPAPKMNIKWAMVKLKTIAKAETKSTIRWRSERKDAWDNISHLHSRHHGHDSRNYPVREDICYQGSSGYVLEVIGEHQRQPTRYRDYKYPLGLLHASEKMYGGRRASRLLLSSRSSAKSVRTIAHDHPNRAPLPQGTRGL